MTPFQSNIQRVELDSQVLKGNGFGDPTKRSFFCVFAARLLREKNLSRHLSFGCLGWKRRSHAFKVQYFYAHASPDV